jgi:glucosamine kinase
MARIPEGSFFIGVDGGGSGCRARIADRSGRVLGNGNAAPAAVRLGVDRALAAVGNAARAAAAQAGLPPEALGMADAVVGLAGIGRKDVLEQLIARQHPFRSVRYENDATIACVGAHKGRDGGVVIVGTGSVGLAIIGGREIRVGGYGFPISDEASGADLGLHAIRLALRTHDGRTAKTGFTRELMARFDNDAFEVVAWADHATATDYAKFAPLVMHHAENGDPLAAQIVVCAAEEINELAGRLSNCGVKRFALLGGLGARMTPWLAPDVQQRLVASQGDALDGALHLARRAANTKHAA